MFAMSPMLQALSPMQILDVVQLPAILQDDNSDRG